MTKKLVVVKMFNQVVEVTSVNGGWTTFKDAAGEPGKIRNSQLREPTESEIASFKPGAAKPEKPVKAPSKARGKPRKVKDDLAEHGLDDEGDDNSLIKPDYTRYTKHDVKSPSGRKALDISDGAADLLRGQDITDCYFIVAKHMAKQKGEERDVDQIEKELIKSYKHLNIGMQRMNLGNRLRKLMGIYGNLNAHKTRKPRAMAAKRPKSSNSMSIKVAPRRRKTDKKRSKR